MWQTGEIQVLSHVLLMFLKFSPEHQPLFGHKACSLPYVSPPSPGVHSGTQSPQSPVTLLQCSSSSSLCLRCLWSLLKLRVWWDWKLICFSSFNVCLSGGVSSILSCHYGNPLLNYFIFVINNQHISTLHFIMLLCGLNICMITVLRGSNSHIEAYSEH